MTKQETNGRKEQEEKQEFLEKRGLAWGAHVVLLVVTMLAALVLAYFITIRNFPAR